MESSFQLMIAYMFHSVKFTALFIKITCRALSLSFADISCSVTDAIIKFSI